MHTKEFAKYDQLHSSTVYQMTDFIKSNDTLVMKEYHMHECTVLGFKVVHV